jgi:hypothetical protein
MLGRQDQAYSGEDRLQRPPTGLCFCSKGTDEGHSERTGGGGGAADGEVGRPLGSGERYYPMQQTGLEGEERGNWRVPSS